MDDLKDASLYGRREMESIILYRVDQAEQTIRRLTDNYEILIRLQTESSTQVSNLEKMNQRVNTHGTALDIIAPKISRLETITSVHSWFLGIIFGSGLTAIIGKLIGML